MGLLKTGGYFIVALIAILAYFHMECEREKSEKAAKSRFDKFDGQKTNCEVEYTFAIKGNKYPMFNVGYSYFIIQGAPCAVKKLHAFFYGKSVFDPDFSYKTDGTKSLGIETDTRNITIFDARKQNPGDFHKTGFTLVKLDEEPITEDWRTSHFMNESADITNFHK